MDLAIVGVAVLIVPDDGICKELRIGLGAVAPTPIRAKKAEKIVSVSRKCLKLGMDAVKPGNTVGDIGYAIQKYAASQGCSVVKDAMSIRPTPTHNMLSATLKAGQCFSTPLLSVMYTSMKSAPGLG
jgi:methionine aminopeptidase